MLGNLSITLIFQEGQMDLSIFSVCLKDGKSGLELIKMENIFGNLPMGLI
jgi:hypothetical protein